MQFNENANLHNALNNFVQDLIYNKYTERLWDVEFLNSMDKTELGQRFAYSYMRKYPNECETEEYSQTDLSKYAAVQIDRLIPRIYFLETKIDLCNKYTPLLARRLYDVKGKDGFKATVDFKYQFEHDFTQEKEILKETTATDKQITFLKKLGQAEGYLLWHEEFLSKTYANQMITYLQDKQGEQPTVFPFFFVSK